MFENFSRRINITPVDREDKLFFLIKTCPQGLNIFFSTTIVSDAAFCLLPFDVRQTLSRSLGYPGYISDPIVL